MKPIASGYRYESEFFSSLGDLQGIVLPAPGAEFPILVRQDFLSPEEAESLMAWQAKGAARDATIPVSDETGSRLSGSLQDGRVVLPDESVLKLCGDLAMRAREGLENHFGVRVGRIVETEAITLPEGASCKLHTDHAVRQYDADGWLAGWPSTTDSALLTLLFFLTDGVDEVAGDNQCVGGNIEFPYMVNQDLETVLLEPRRLMLLAFPDHPVYSYRIHEVYDKQSCFVAAWGEAEAS